VSTANASHNKMILQLKGHLNAITDLQYSHAGDRILTGSQKDGVFRIWSWDVDPSISDSQLQIKDRGLRSIVAKLTNPMASASIDSKKVRRRAPAGIARQESKIQLDVAVWSFDDTKIITSQSQLLNPKEEKIHPDTHFMFMWDSQTGHCLLGIAGGHTMTCQVILPHPSNASIFCSAGLDGYVKVWNCETGKCLFSHKHVPSDNQSDDGREKISGFLDGASFPDGTGFVLTDNTGNVAVFDSILTSSQRKPSSDPSSLPSLPPPPYWLKAQYYSNDYYDLFYDANGYCVEQGSEQPPHLAPRGVRCSPSGATFPETTAITEAFRKLPRPQPSSVRECRWLRESIRLRSRLARPNATKCRVGGTNRRGNIMQEYDPLTTILVRAGGDSIHTRNVRGDIMALSSLSISASQSNPNRQISSTSHATGNEPRHSSSGRQLSSNYRWRDYNDMLREEGDMDESEDEEFQPRAMSSETSARRAESDEESEDDLLSPPRRQNARQPSARPPSRRRTSESSEHVEEVAVAPRPSRASTRRAAARSRYDEDESDEDVVEEFVRYALLSTPFSFSTSVYCDPESNVLVYRRSQH
jgi:hypothetical protein